MLFTVLLWGSFVQAAMTPAGTVIQSRATVTYQDNSKNIYTAVSNESKVIVAEVHAAKLEQDNTLNAVVQQTVYFPHQLTVNGNVGIAFKLSVEELTGFPDGHAVNIYQDHAGNGVVSPGDNLIGKDEAIFVNPDTPLNLVVQVVVPESASNDKDYTFKIKATPVKSKLSENLVNTNTLKLSSGPVLVSSKRVLSHSVAKEGKPGAVTYSIKITNNGDGDITTEHEAKIIDPLSNLFKISAGNLNTDPNVTGVKLVSADASRIDTSSIRVEIVQSERTAPYSHDFQLIAPIKKLEKGHTMALVFTVEYEYNAAMQAGDKLKNIAKIEHKKKLGDPDSETNKVTITTNITTTETPWRYGVKLANRGNGGNTVSVRNAIVGQEVIFKARVENTGNTPDRFTLEVVSDEEKDLPNFPAGTQFSFWDWTGKTAYIGDSETSFGTLGLTPEIAPQTEVQIVIKALLPKLSEELSEADLEQLRFTDRLVAVSKGDKTKTDSIDLKVNGMKKAVSLVDLSYAENAKNSKADANGYEQDVSAENSNRQIVKAGTAGRYTVYIQNQSDKARTFYLRAVGSVEGGERGSYTKPKALPSGWQVFFKNDQGVRVNEIFIEAGSSLRLTVELRLPVDQAVIQNHPFAILAESDKVMAETNDAIKLFVSTQDMGQLTLTPNGQGQIEAGGVINYSHVLTNQTSKTLFLTLTSKSEDAGWTHVISFGKGAKVDENGVLELTPGASIPVFARVSSPSNAKPGSLNVLTLTATEVNKAAGEVDKPAGMVAIATDTTILINRQIRLVKQVAVIRGDDLKEGDRDAAAVEKSKTITEFAENIDMNSGPVPGKDYVVWQVVTTNAGSSPALNVTIEDVAPAYTSVVVKGAYVHQGVGTASQNGAPRLIFYVGADATESKGGELKPGESVEVRFVVKVD